VFVYENVHEKAEVYPIISSHSF